MGEPTSNAKSRITPLLWVAVALVFCGVECAVISSHIHKPGYKPSLWLFHQPVVLSFPLLTAHTILRRLKSGSDIQSNTEIQDYMSYNLALFTLISYLTLWNGIGDYL